MPTMYWLAEQAVVLVRLPLGTCSSMVQLQLMSRTRQLFMHPGIAYSWGTRACAAAESRQQVPTCAAREKDVPQQSPTDLGGPCGQGADAIPQGCEAREDGV